MSPRLYSTWNKHQKEYLPIRQLLEALSMLRMTHADLEAIDDRLSNLMELVICRNAGDIITQFNILFENRV